MIKLTANKLIYLCILIFPITTVLQGLPYLDAVNRIVMFLLIILVLISFFISNIDGYDLLILLFTVVSTIIMVVLTEGNTDGFNIYIYFPLWIIFFIYLRNHYLELAEIITDYLLWIQITLLLWSAIIIVSVFSPSSYEQVWGGVYFASFADGGHRFAMSCFTIFVLAWICYKVTRNKKQILWCLIPTIGILASGARTYLGVFVLFIFGICYQQLNNKKKFVLTIIPLTIILLAIVLISPIGSKIIVSLEGGGYYGYWATVTNGRNKFWAADVNAYYHLPIVNKLIGKGVNYVFDVNEASGHGRIWAHNDFLNLLLSNGLFGLILYLSVFFRFAKKHRNNIMKTLVSIFYIIWFLNAMFNMVYTYTGAVLTIPLILMAFSIGKDGTSVQKLYREEVIKT